MKFFKEANKELDIEDVKEAGEFVVYNRAWHYIKNVNLENPKLFTEKIQWLKLNDRRDTYTLCADKYLVRNYVEEKIGSKYLIPLVSITENYNDINENNLPDYPVIVKTTHDSGGTFIIKDKILFLSIFVLYIDL